MSGRVSAAATKHFSYMFPTLAADPAKRLVTSPDTIAALRALGVAMAVDTGSVNSTIPAAFTYFGQFIDHDITKLSFANAVDLKAPNFPPMSITDIESSISNARTAKLDLDSVYGGLAATEATLTDGRMALGEVVTAPFGTIPTADRNHDFKRRPPNAADEFLDRQALIGDERNDENLLVAQMHVGFLRAHNAILTRTPALGADGTKSELRRRYQWAVLHDFLNRVCRADVVADVLTNGPTFLKFDTPNAMFIPVEFSGAAYRFGHSMIRQEYSHNATFNPQAATNRRATFDNLFSFTALSGEINPAGGPTFQFPQLPDNWIIEWRRFFASPALPNGPGRNPARRIDTKLAFELSQLPDGGGVVPADLMAQLATRNLLRGYLLGLPTGQAVADHMGVPIISAQVLQDAVPISALQKFTNAGFLTGTPLWFYILAEAGDPGETNGNALGMVGSRIVAETLWNAVFRAQDSVLQNPPTAAELATGEFTLKGIIKLGHDTRLPRLI